LVALCQGAALHYADGSRGVNDFDVYSFYRDRRRTRRFPWRSHYTRHYPFRDFGVSKFGTHPDDEAAGYEGRRIDYFRRSIPFAATGVDSVRNWLQTGGGLTPEHLKQRPVVCLWPDKLRGKIIWDPKLE